jgi:hypothetical protein
MIGGDQTRRSRREILRGGLRIAAAGALAAVAAALGTRLLRSDRREGVDRRTQVCANRFICSGCASVESCGLPQAMSARRARRGQP